MLHDERLAGACAYIKLNLSDGKFGVQVVAAKSRVASLNGLSRCIPGLELQAVVIKSRLGSFILYESRLISERVRYLTNNCVALAWI